MSAEPVEHQSLDSTEAIASKPKPERDSILLLLDALTSDTARDHHTQRDLDLLDSGLFADATITCGDRTWKVHKSIICRCDWFKKAFTGCFLEAHTRIANLSADDFSSELVNCVILYIYSGVVDIEKVINNDSVIDACVQLWNIADFLMYKELENDALTILTKYCDAKVEALCFVNETKDTKFDIKTSGYEELIAQVFHGIKTAYTQYPHAKPCHEVVHRRSFRTSFSWPPSKAKRASGPMVLRRNITAESEKEIAQIAAAQAMITRDLGQWIPQWDKTTTFRLLLRGAVLDASTGKA
ncbi:hypothetical protein Daus18300_008250 [Diaporthe australafricana]|uniref:BTB domain-containing protein n=1 Tax=Diaporthe australafricana TaxID=127596 RepID=A0ABR3WJR1_9PEZI